MLSALTGKVNYESKNHNHKVKVHWYHSAVFSVNLQSVAVLWWRGGREEKNLLSLERGCTSVDRLNRLHLYSFPVNLYQVKKSVYSWYSGSLWALNAHMMWHLFIRSNPRTTQLCMPFTRFLISVMFMSLCWEDFAIITRLKMCFLPTFIALVNWP